MPVVLRTFQAFPKMQPDNTFIDERWATIAFIDEGGNQYAQLNVHASELPENAHLFDGDETCLTCDVDKVNHTGDHLAFSLGDGHGLSVSADHSEMILATQQTANN